MTLLLGPPSRMWEDHSIEGAFILYSSEDSIEDSFILCHAPETFDLFDDVILMGEGKIVHHGPRTHVLEFFESCGFRCPERKGVADFLQEVMSKKDQAQYGHATEETYSYISIDALSRKFRESSYGKNLSQQLSSPLVKYKCHKDAMTFTAYSLPKWELFKACLSREFLLVKRNSFLHIFKSVQIFITASIIMTLFLRTRMEVDIFHANYYMGALFYAVAILAVNGLPELSFTVARLAVFYKQRDLSFYPAWAFAISSSILKVPLSLLEAVVFTCMTYYVFGYSPEPGRFFSHLAVCVVCSSPGIYIRVPFVYDVNFQMLQSNITIGRETLSARGLNFDEYFFWISLGALFGFALLFNIGFTLALSVLHPVRPCAIISREKLSQLRKCNKTDDSEQAKEKSRSSFTMTGSQKGVILTQLAIEIPYVFIQTVAFTVITYPMIGFYWSAYKIFWYMYAVFCTLLYYNYLSMMTISMTPSFPLAAILQSVFYNVFLLFGGYLIPRPEIPKWWLWLYYLNPISWSVNGMFTSQYGDINRKIKAFGQTKTVAMFLRDYFGFRHNELPIVAVILNLYPTVFACLFLYCISKLNFQKR